MFGRILSRALALSVFVFACSLFLVGQDLDDVTINGKVTDSNGLAVVGASVTVTAVETGESRTLVTDDDGQYRFLKLKPGTYKVKAAASGFGILETPGIPTISAQNVQKDFKLTPADVRAEQTVTVTEDDGPPVDTTRTIVGGTVTEREIEEIPNNTRNALDLVLTLGGTSEEQLSTNDLAEDRGQNPSNAPLEQGNFSISGGTAYSNNLTIDGFDNNDDRSSRDRFQPSLEGISEVQVISNQFSSEYGRASGGRINIRTRSGGKNFRGRVFMFFRDESLNANTWFNNQRGIRRPALQELNPGFTLSGPVILPGFGDGADYPWFDGRKHKTFFAIAYENLKLADTTLIDAYLPIDANPNYPLPNPTGTTLYCDAPGSPAPPCAAGVAAIAAYNKLYDTPNKGNIFTARIDTELFKNNNFTFGFQYGRKNNQRTSGNTVTRLENAFQAKNINTDAYNFTDNHVFGARAVNQVRVQWSRYEPSFQAPNPFDPVVIVGIRDPIAGAVRSLVMGNSTASSGSNFPDTRNETRWQFQESLTYLTGSHTLKMGFDIQNVDSKVIGLGDATGTFNFQNSFTFTQNMLSRFRQNFGTGQDVKNRYYGVFLNDEFKPWSNVTISAGLRYERETAVSDKNNFGPRLGIAWDPFKKGKGVIRFGTGIFYNRVLLRTVGDSIQNSGGNLVNFDSNAIGTAATDSRRVAILAALSARFPSSYPSVNALRALVTETCATVVTTFSCNSNTGFTTGNVSSAGNPLRSVEADLKIPESYQFNVGFERELFKGWVFEANYTWNKTVHLWRDYNSNAALLPAGYTDWNDYLTRTGSPGNVYILSPTRRYTFFNGLTNDPSGLHDGSQTGGACTVNTANCFVNLNTTNSSSTAPAIAVTGTNFNATGAPIGIATAAIAPFRPDQTVSETSQIGSRGNAFYQGLILELRSRYRKLGHGFGASFRFAYTLSKTMDDGLNNTANAEVNGDFSREWARSLQDRRHRFSLTGTFEGPWWLGKLRLSPRFRYGTSGRFNLGDGGSDRNLDDLGTDRVNFSGNLDDIVFREPGTPLPADLFTKFSLQPIGARSGNLPRNAGTAPSFYTFDLSVTREWRFLERFKLRPVVQFDNILNAAVFNYGAAFIDLTAGSASFLVPTRTIRPRQIRLGMRFDF
ncbi:MAG: TonB-dependent receptor [Chloracidobacterium sp.]|nr:TonB-dependent receptor [Chloracidobacterium sp.]